MIVREEFGGAMVVLDGVSWPLPSTPWLPEYHLQHRKLPDGRMAIGYLTDVDDAENPFAPDWYYIYSFNRRHSNFKTLEDIVAKRLLAPKNKHMSQILAWYGHSGELWALRWELPPECRCEFDSHNFAGIWLPSAECCDQIRKEALRGCIEGTAGGAEFLARSKRPMGLRSMQAWAAEHLKEPAAYIRSAECETAKQYARRACQTWTAYVNGEVYDVVRTIVRPSGELDTEETDRYYGSEEAANEIKRWLENLDITATQPK